MQFANRRRYIAATDAPVDLNYDPAADADPTYTGGEAPAEATAARVVSVSSFTKILAPGLRVGWLEAAPALVDRLAARGYVVSGGGVAPLASQIASRVVASGDLDACLATTCANYKRRCDALLAACDAASDVLEPLCRPTGGLGAPRPSSLRLSPPLTRGGGGGGDRGRTVGCPPRRRRDPRTHRGVAAAAMPVDAPWAVRRVGAATRGRTAASPRARRHPRARPRRRRRPRARPRQAHDRRRFFVWCRLKGGISATALLEACAGEVAFLAGGACDSGGDALGDAAALDEHVRLCFTMYGEVDLAEGVARIARAARRIAV